MTPADAMHRENKSKILRGFLQQDHTVKHTPMDDPFINDFQSWTPTLEVSEVRSIKTPSAVSEKLLWTGILSHCVLAPTFIPTQKPSVMGVYRKTSSLVS